MPDFKARHDARVRRKAEELAPYIEKAMQRIPPLPEMKDVPEVESYPVLMQRLGAQIDDTTIGKKLSASVAGALEQ